MQMSELVTAFFLSELATYTVTDSGIPLLYGLFPVIMMICIEVIISFFAVKFPVIKKLFDFKPSFLIQNGNILEKQLLKNRLTLDELFSLLRLCGYYDISQVKYAILEPNGQLSVVPFSKAEPLVREDLNIQAEEKGYSVALIEDGKINRKALDAIQKDERWLKGIFRKEKIQSEKDIFLLASNFVGEIIIIFKEKKKT